MTDFKYKLVDYDGGLSAHPVFERAGQLWLVGTWWKLQFKHAEECVKGALAHYVLEALPVDDRSCLVSIREPGSHGEILCTFLLPDTPARRFTRDLDQHVGQVAASAEESDAESHGRSAGRAWRGPTGSPARMNGLVGAELQFRLASALEGSLESSSVN